ncbi:MAG: hypothetical protein R3F62_07340 [Planctomycetota bacterium]
MQAARRAFEASGSPHDEATFLTERTRAGELAPDRLELAAYLGHPAARLAAGGPCGADDDLRRTRAWLEPLFQRSVAFSVRVALLAAHELHPALKRNKLGAYLTKALRLWLEEPGAHGLARIQDATRQLFAEAEAQDTAEARDAATSLAGVAVIAEGVDWDQVPAWPLTPPPKTLRAIREALRDELVPWALEPPAP